MNIEIHLQRKKERRMEGERGVRGKQVMVERGEEEGVKCPRCDSRNTKFCYFNNYSKSQPRYLCKCCRRYWTLGGALRNIPVGGASRKPKRPPPRPCPHLLHHHHLPMQMQMNPLGVGVGVGGGFNVANVGAEQHALYPAAEQGGMIPNPSASHFDWNNVNPFLWSDSAINATSNTSIPPPLPPLPPLPFAPSSSFIQNQRLNNAPPPPPPF